MSKLEYYARPLAAFDPNNKQHRTHYADFVRNRGWGRCPVRFIVPEETGRDLVTMIQDSLLKYYVEREFKIKE
jgi:hypothetical protein